MSIIQIKTPCRKNKFIKIVNQIKWQAKLDGYLATPHNKNQLVRAPIAMLISRSAYFVAKANS